jgi:6,7-dimethyl-8-ribityllumazine synthase
MSGEGRPAGHSPDAAGLSVAIAATHWHAEITDQLVARAVAALETALVLRSIRE